MAQARQCPTLRSVLDSAPFLPMSHPLPARHGALSNPKPTHLPPSINLLRLPLNGQEDQTRKLKPLEILGSPNSDSAHVCNVGNGEHGPTQLPTTAGMPDGSRLGVEDNSCSLPQKREQWWVSDMDEYLAASQLCREEAMACWVQAVGVHWPIVEREKIKQKSPLLTCRALNAGTNKSWRGLKKVFSKQFMPFSNRDHRGLHHINTTISKRPLKNLNVGGRKMEARNQLGTHKSEFVVGREKGNREQNGNAMREPSSMGVEICQSSRLGSSCEMDHHLQQGRLKKGGFKKKVHILLNKASGVALEVCDILNLE